METKKKIREKFLKQRLQIQKDERSIWETELSKRLFNLALFKTAENVLLYASFGSEASTWEIIEKCLKMKNVYLPKVSGNIMDFYLIKQLEDLEPGSFGIMEPKKSCLKINREILDIKNTFMLIPGTAFDESGNRIGYGKGYYDNYVKNYSGIKCGFCFEMQLRDDIPSEKNDQKVNMILTEKRTIVL